MSDDDGDDMETLFQLPPEKWPKPSQALPTVMMTAWDLAKLPEYSSSIPDSYKRPIADGGRPWRRNLNWAKHHTRGEPGEMWVRGEYIPDPKGEPNMLGIKWERVIIVNPEELPWTPEQFTAYTSAGAIGDILEVGHGSFTLMPESIAALFKAVPSFADFCRVARTKTPPNHDTKAESAIKAPPEA